MSEVQSFLAALELKHGSHNAIESGACVMEAVAYVAGEPHSDHPKCASRVLTSFCIKLNDRWGTERRQKLKPFILRLVGTAADLPTEKKRAYMCADWAVRELLPMALEVAKVADWPEKLRALPPIADVATANAGRDLAREARRAARAAYAYADADAYADAAADAAAYAAAADAYADAAAYAAAADAYADAAADAAAYAAAAYAYADAAADAYADAAYADRAKADASALALLDRLILVSPGPFEQHRGGGR